MIAKYLKKKNFILCPKSFHKKIIKEINSLPQLVSYQIMDWQEFLNNYFFSYTKEAIYFIMKEKKVRYEIALEYLDAFYYLEEKEYSSSKLKELVSLKKQLEELHYLQKNPLFVNSIKNSTIILYGYHDFGPFQEKIFQNWKDVVKVEESGCEKKLTAYQFTEIDTEIAYICEEIRKKLETVPISNIKLIHPSREYMIPLKRIFAWYQLPLDCSEKVSLYATLLGKKILEQFQKNYDFSETLQVLEGELGEEFDSVLTIFNDYYSWAKKDELLLEMLEYEFKHTYLQNKSKENSISYIELEELADTDNGFLLGFNQENYPKIYQDEEFLSDSMKQELGLLDSNQKNIQSIKNLKEMLYQKKNLTITYKEKTAFDSYNPCFLITEMNMEVISNPILSYQMSHRFNEITLAKELDKYEKYGILSDSLQKLISNYPTIPYQTYQHQFQKIEESVFLNSLSQPLILSYSAIDEYYHCSFRYYVSNILKIQQENSDDFYRNIGNIFHYVLSKAFQQDFDFEKSWQEEAQKYEFTFSQLLFLEKLKQELKYDIKVIKKQETYSRFNQYYFEKRFSIPIPNAKNMKVSFTGVVDKICYLKEENQTLATVIDYKTGTLPSNLNNIIYGIGMQLPIYLYFLKRSNLFPHLEIVGFYLQKIINKEIKRVPKKTVEELKEQALKLVGYSTTSEELLEKFDETYQDSQMIAGLKTKVEGFYKGAKVLDKEEFEKLDALVDTNIKKACKHILEGDFTINPKKIGKDLVGCEYCSYRDICYHTEEDIIELEKYTDLEFLRGDEDARMDERAETSN